MAYWLHRIAHSRRVRTGSFATIALLTAGTCGGALLADYTVAGMDPVYVARAEPVDIQPKRGAADWLAEEAFRKDRTTARFADPWKAEPAD